MKNVKFLYVRDDNNFPVGTVAYKVRSRNGKPMAVDFAYSSYYVKDDFSKVHARQLTADRLRHFHFTVRGDNVERMLVQALRQMSRHPANPWKEGKNSKLGHRFVSACRNTASRLGSALAGEYAA